MNFDIQKPAQKRSSFFGVSIQTKKNLGQTCHTVLYALSSIFDNLEVNASDIQDKMTNAKEINGYKNTSICQRYGMEDHCVIAR